MTMPLLEQKFRDKTFLFETTPHAPAMIAEIFGDNYKVFEANIEFRPGDVVLDLGACEGMFSILMGKMFPDIRIIALEPVLRTYHHLLRNIGLNGVTNLEAHNFGVGKAHEKLELILSKDGYSGGSSAKMTYNPEQNVKEMVEVYGLDEIFAMFSLEKVRLLKMDIEGMEYDALYNSTVLPQVDFFTGEFHMNLLLDVKGFRMDGLANWVNNRTKIIRLEPCMMAQ